MENYKSAIYNFIDKMGYLLDKDCEGIIFYGSYQHGFAKENSDIDLCVIFNNDSGKGGIRGISIEDNYRIEYFEQTIDGILERARNDIESGSNAILSMIGYGQCIYDCQGKIKDLQQRIIDYYNNNPLPRLSENEIEYITLIINNRIEELKEFERDNHPSFNYLYYYVLEKIRELYYHKNGLPEIPVAKVFDFYQDDTYSQKLHKITPPSEFRDLFLAALDQSKSNKERLDNLILLYCYTIENTDIEYKDTRVSINPTTPENSPAATIDPNFHYDEKTEEFFTGLYKILSKKPSHDYY